MPDFAVVLYFDKATEKTLAPVYARLRRVGVLPLGIRPHVTLWSASTSRVEDLKKAFRRLAPKVRRLDLSLEHFGIFPKGVLFLGPVVTRQLKTAHGHCLRLLRPAADRVYPYYEQDRLVFHCTLGMKLSAGLLKKVLASAQKSLALPLGARATELALVEVPPFPIKVKNLVVLRLRP